MLSVRIPWVRTENPLFSTRCLNADVGQHGAIVCIPATGIPNSRNAPADAGEISITIAMSRRVSMRHGFVGMVMSLAPFQGNAVNLNIFVIEALDPVFH